MSEEEMTVDEALNILKRADPNPLGLAPEFMAMRILILHLMDRDK